MKNTRVLILVLIMFGFILSGCWTIDLKDFATPEGAPDYLEISKPYHLTELRKSTAADVLPMMYMPEYTLLSQSTKVLAAQGTKKKGLKKWFTMVTFDENDLLAKRKYLMIADEKPKVILVQPWAGLRFDCQMILEGEVVEEPYTDENARRIAILKFVRQITHDDLIEVKPDNKEYEISGAMINQALEAVLQDLDESPALAVRLSDMEGLKFEHVTFDRGKIQMTDDGKAVTVKMRLGSFTRGFEKIEDVNYPPELEEEY
ncbi:MAG: hypothetical protein JW837_19385 [Sedimentisphaerales bacterium]|nr:hypothetical protein [Sedimentisphaerales bacterium]